MVMTSNEEILLFPYFAVKFCQERNGKMESCEGVSVKHLFLVVFTIPLYLLCKS